jgi:DNA topoisomerase VI subunit B
MTSEDNMDNQYETDTAEVVDFASNLERRVRNLALGPKTPSNSLVPLYEAIYNSIHAIQDRFKDDWTAKSRITISLKHFGTDSPSIQISDNGIGLNRENFGNV